MSSERTTTSSVECPFCGENDFDLPGLKFHLTSGYCDKFEDCERPLSAFECAAAEAELPTGGRKDE